jgi:hypothetical protein
MERPSIEMALLDPGWGDFPAHGWPNAFATNSTMSMAMRIYITFFTERSFPLRSRFERFTWAGPFDIMIVRIGQDQ